MKPNLLVSVRDANEARLVSRYEIGIVDAKEPRTGSLGQVSDADLWQLLEAVSPNQMMSIALGELGTANYRAWDQALLARFDYAKIGLSGAADRPDWQAELSRLMSALPPQVARVAVAYVDCHRCRAPAIAAVVAAGAELGCAAVLLDTCDKSAGDLFNYVDADQLRQLVTQIQSTGMRAVVAGSVSSDTLETVLDSAPDFVGVRGAVCRSNRAAAIDKDELRRFVNLYLDLVETKFVSPHSPTG